MKVCLVIGAGASLDQARHFRPSPRDAGKWWPPLDTSFFEKVEKLGLDLTPALRAYIRALTGTDPTSELLRQYRMEEFFKDLYFDFSDRPLERRVRAAYTDLVTLYSDVLRETTNWLGVGRRTGGPLGRVIAAAAGIGDEELTIITFNHDLVIENEILKRARLRRRWCVDRGYGSFSSDLERLRATSGSVEFPRHSAGCTHTTPITILKLHGSLNWIVRIHGRQPTAKDLTGEGRLRNVFLDAEREIERILYMRGGGGAGRKSWHTWPVVVPPIYSKRALISRLQRTWDDARAALSHADRVIFYGYSLPQLDIEAEKLIQRGLSANSDLAWADVINPQPASAERYAGIAPSRRLRWYPTSSSFLDAA